MNITLSISDDEADKLFVEGVNSFIDKSEYKGKVVCTDSAKSKTTKKEEISEEMYESIVKSAICHRLNIAVEEV